MAHHAADALGTVARGRVESRRATGRTVARTVRPTVLSLMRLTIIVLQMLARLLGAAQILIGFAIWFGWAPNAVVLHTALGSLFVLVLWIIAAIALFALSKRGVALFTLLWGALVLWLGMAQTTLLPGGVHWAVRLAHLLVGLAAMGLVESLGKAVKLHSRVNALSASIARLDYGFGRGRGHGHGHGHGPRRPASARTAISRVSLSFDSSNPLNTSDERSPDSSSARTSA